MIFWLEVSGDLRKARVYECEMLVELVRINNRISGSHPSGVEGIRLLKEERTAAAKRIVDSGMYEIV